MSGGHFQYDIAKAMGEMERRYQLALGVGIQISINFTEKDHQTRFFCYFFQRWKKVKKQLADAEIEDLRIQKKNNKNGE